jgi:RNA polymerase sigma factor (sigma-70 family)
MWVEDRLKGVHRVNDKGDFEQFVAGRSGVLLRTAYLLCAGDRGAAEDLLQDVLERMYPKWRRIKGEPEAYARVALANASANRYRRRSRRVRETVLVDVSHPQVHGPESEVVARDEVVRALGALPDRMRAVIVLRFFDDLTEVQTAAADELGATLRAATTDLQPRPSLTQDVLRGGVRRQRHRRIAIVGASTAAAVAVAAAASLVSWQTTSEPTQVAKDTLLTAPTRGDLAKDNAFLGAATQAWVKNSITAKPYGQKGPLAEMLGGQPHVYWAGNTSAGRAAVVVQERKDSKDIFRGLVTSKPSGELTVPIVDLPEQRAGGDLGYRFGDGDRTVLALDPGRTLYVSDKVSYDAAGKAVRNWQPMKAADGVVLAELPAGTGPMDAKVIRTEPTANIGDGDVVDLIPADTEAVNADKNHKSGLGLQRADGGMFMSWVGTEPAHWNDPGWLWQHFSDGLAGSGLLDSPDSAMNANPNPWYVSVGDASGGTTVIGEHTPAQNGPSRLYAVELDKDGKTKRVTAKGATDPAAALPVLVSLGDKGWVAAAADATLSYRTGPDAAWEGARAEAIVAPPDATQIQVKIGTKTTVIDVH